MAVLACPALRVLIVDDEELLRLGLSHILDSAPDLRVVGACHGRQAVERVGELRPDVVLLDVRMPDVDGLTVLRALRALPEPPEVAMLTTFDLNEYLSQAMSDGAAGFLLKDTEPKALISAVRALGTGSGCLSAPLVRRLSRRPDNADTTAARALAALSDREREVLALLREGLSNAEIAQRLHLATGTVKEYVSSLLTKLGVENRLQAAVLATRSHLATADRPGA
ncbi:response regulator transcription factor [Streptomyces sp. NBC_01244]|uniref:response regulator transcription factor n=1 Tax=Streptomyces sp. NBC_01244 TaxID=2903797 RepID=UPI002E133B6A|nr:response regulator transcription factor [Streptomyces sp. NBC_01244]